jgi:amino acid permease
MLGPLDYALWCLGVLAEIAVVVCVIRTKSFLRYYSLVFYILCDAIVTSGLFYCVHYYGYSSTQYA